MTTIRVRLTLWYLLLLSITLTLFSAVTYVGVSRSVRARFDRSISLEVANFVAESEIEEDGELDLELEVLSHGERVVAYDKLGKVVTRVGLPLAESRGAAPKMGFDTVMEAGVPWRRLAVEAPKLGLTLQVSRSREEIDRSLSYLLGFLASAVPLTVLMAGAGGLFLASRSLNPLDRITRAAASLSAEGLSQRLPRLESQDEMSRLVDTFNDMLERLEGAFQRQKQFTSDAAHELRTPLALLLARAELTASRPRSQAEYKEAMEEILAAVERMSSMVAKLLTLARDDAGGLVLRTEPLDLAELAEDVIAELASLHPEVDIQGRLSPAPIAGDQTRLTEIVMNLLDNAIAFSPPGERITVCVESRDSLALLTVSDSGPGVPATLSERIFERFYQADQARPGAAARGAGLGLAICRAIARQHGGRLYLATDQQKGAKFVLELPLGGAADSTMT